MTFNKKKSILNIVLFFFLFTCKTARVNDDGTLNKKITTKQVINQHNKSKSKFLSYSGRIKIEIVEETKSQSYSLSLRIDKDKTIWMSKLGIVKAIMTQNRVAFYNKLDQTYFDGNFDYISHLLGTELDFFKVQNILLGESIYHLNENAFSAKVYEKSYLLTPKKQLDLFELFLLFNASHFKMDSQQITQEKKGRHLEINYKTYQNIDEEILPQIIKVNALEHGESLILNLDFKNIELNKKLSFPFKIPDGFKAIDF